MRACTLHTTLVFLGDVEHSRLEALQLVAQEVNGISFDLVFDAARYWEHNHIAYAAPNFIPPQLTQLVQDLKRCLSKHYFNFDKHPYTPHVTLLRNAQRSNVPLPERDRVTWQARDYVLVQSAPDVEGANYQILAKFALSIKNISTR